MRCSVFMLLVCQSYCYSFFVVPLLGNSRISTRKQSFLYEDTGVSLRGNNTALIAARNAPLSIPIIFFHVTVEILLLEDTQLLGNGYDLPLFGRSKG